MKQIDVWTLEHNIKIRLTNMDPVSNLISVLESVIISAFIEVVGEIPLTQNIKYLVGKDDISDEDLEKNGKYAYQDIYIDDDKSRENILAKYPNSKIIPITTGYEIIINPDFVLFGGCIIACSDYDTTGIKECFELKEEPDEPRVYLVLRDSYEDFVKYPIELNVKDMEGNYNDDLPHDKINEILRKKESALLLLHGDPGTGKSSYIRNLVKENCKDVSFLYIDPSTFRFMNDSSFISFLSENHDCVLILEDCESLLKSRDTNYNDLISVLLGLSDGLLGDAFNLKFICTFNTDYHTIDKALLRKGRLKMKYEFKKLAKDKVAAILKKQNITNVEPKEMSLAEVYNILEENGGETKRKSVGFN